MQAATRLGIAFLLLIAAFVALIALAVSSLLATKQLMLAAVVAVAGVAGLIAGGLTYMIVRRDEDEPAAPLVVDPPPQPVALPKQPAAMAMPRRPLKVQSMPVANLPAAYVDAVMRGARARTSALKAQARESGLPR